MATRKKIVCDICGVEKGETNHWLVAWSEPNFSGIAFQPQDVTEEPRSAALRYEDICGQECAHKRLSQYLETLK